MKASLAVPAAALALLGEPALAQNGDPSQGLVVARELCAGCHAVQSSDWASPNALAPPFGRLAEREGSALVQVLQSPHQNITVPPAQLRNIVAYILSLK